MLIYLLIIFVVNRVVEDLVLFDVLYVYVFLLNWFNLWIVKVFFLVVIYFWNFFVIGFLYDLNYLILVERFDGELVLYDIIIFVFFIVYIVDFMLMDSLLMFLIINFFCLLIIIIGIFIFG